MDRSALQRRDVLLALSASAVTGAVTGIAGGFLDAVGEKLYNSVFERETLGDIDRESLRAVLGESISPPSIYAGERNAIGATLGLEGVSEYLRFAASRFSNYVAAGMGLQLNTVPTNDGPEFIYDQNSSAVFLGSPAANHVTSRLLGYSNVEIALGGKKTFMPQLQLRATPLRWAFLYGDTGFGIYDGQSETARRYSKRTGKLVERPIYKVLDIENGVVFTPRTANGFLIQEWLTVVRIAEFGTYKVIVGGLHGYSIEGFCRDLTTSMAYIASVTGGLDEYQVLIPVTLDHRPNAVGVTVTAATLEWQDAEVQQVRRVSV